MSAPFDGQLALALFGRCLGLDIEFFEKFGDFVVPRKEFIRDFRRLDVANAQTFEGGRKGRVLARLESFVVGDDFDAEFVGGLNQFLFLRTPY